MNYLEEHLFREHMNNVDTKYEDFAREIMNEQNPDTFSLLFATDIHYIRKYAPYIPSYYKVKEMVEFSERVGIDLMAFGGDSVDGNTTLKRQYRDLYDFISLVKKSKTTSVLVTKGNHDDCSWYAYKNELPVKEGAISPEQWYNHVINPIRTQYPIVLDEENRCGGYYYIDYPYHKIRVINLNTSDCPEITDEEGRFKDEKYCPQWCVSLQQAQLKWLVKALTFEEAGWSVMFVSHNTLIKFKDEHDEGTINGDIAWEIIKAYKNNGKGMAESETEYFEAQVEYDFTNNKSNDVLVYLFGHYHEDAEYNKDGITAISVRNLMGNGLLWYNS